MIINWFPLPHCPDKQFEQGNDKGHSTDAGIDVRIAENVVILPNSSLKYEWIDVGPLNDFIGPEIVADLQMGNLKVKGDTLQRKKFKTKLVSTGVKLVRTDETDVSWLMLCLRSSAIKLGLGMPNAVGVIDFAYSNEILLPLYSTCGHAVPLARGESIAQLISIQQQEVDWVKLKEDPNLNVRGGFGSTNV